MWYNWLWQSINGVLLSFLTLYLVCMCVLFVHLRNLDAKIELLRTEGCTALGPALAISAGIIAASPLSEVVLCTDGEPNTGVGNLDTAAGELFYKKVKMLLHVCIIVCFSCF